MTGETEKLRKELDAARLALAEAKACCESRDAEHRAVAIELESARRKVEQAHREWMAALDVVDAPIFLHDKEFRILRCNRAYQQRAGLSFKQIIGQPYYEVFPKTGAPLDGCLRVMEKAEAAADEEEIVIGGTNYRSRTYSVYGEQGGYLHSVHIFEDITEHKRAESALRQNQERLRNIIDGLGPSMFVGLLTTEGAVLEANQQALAAAGLKPEDVLGKPVEETYWFSYSEESKRQMRESVARAARGEASRYDVQIRVAENQYIPLDFSLQPFRDATGKVVLLVPSAIVITERKRAEALLGGQKQVLEMIAVGAHLPEVLTALVRLIEAQSPGMLGSILLLDEDGVHVRHGAAPSLPPEYVAAVDGEPIGPCAGSCGTAAYRKEPVIVEDIATDPLWVNYKAAALPHGLRACWATPIFDVQHRVLGTFAMYFRRPGLPQPEHLRLNDIATQTASIAISHHRAEASLRESESKFRAIIESSPVALAMNDERQNITLLNRKFIETFGYTLDDIPTLAKWWPRAYPDPAYRQRVAQEWQAAVETAQRDRTELEPLEYKVTGKDGTVRDIRFSMAPMGASSLVIFYDVTERKRAEVAIQHAIRALAALSAVNRNLVHASDENELLQAICDAIVEQKGYRMAWVGYVQRDESKSIRIMARAGHEDGYLDGIRLTWAETECGMGPSGRAIRSGTPQVCQDMANDPLYLPWRAAALQHGYASSIALPLLNEDNVAFGILNVYAEEVNAFSPREIGLLEEMAGDLSFGVRAMHTRRERDLAMEQSRQRLAKLESNLEDTVRAIATIVEMRDPYTAGHQARVADLAAAIGRKMGLTGDRVHGIRLAGTVHDLGKIKIPAEILSKPGRITQVEYELIKIHPQAGHDILKGIDFPWPLAQMVLQHHERPDGSGYPQGLKGVPSCSKRAFSAWRTWSRRCPRTGLIAPDWGSRRQWKKSPKTAGSFMTRKWWMRA